MGLLESNEANQAFVQKVISDLKKIQSKQQICKIYVYILSLLAFKIVQIQQKTFFAQNTVNIHGNNSQRTLKMMLSMQLTRSDSKNILRFMEYLLKAVQGTTYKYERFYTEKRENPVLYGKNACLDVIEALYKSIVNRVMECIEEEGTRLIIESDSDISQIQIINFILLPNSKKHFEGPPLINESQVSGIY
ncbi:Hypothetical_protein [Hexamita inflata]|uniref:Hypothetical_protein n=1 Tax=Hexamita inflata TaxID=28002 RepID=A0AA86QV95_9EUKA|nr:Hypothetical protein HINF_LOCUS47963 [Hexamita inflata]